jgi:hypothetical protein
VLICPYCGSKQVRISTKEAYQGWQIGLPKLAHYTKGQKASYSEADCIQCGKSFRPELGEAPSPNIDYQPYDWLDWLHKKLVVETRKGLKIQAKVICVNAAVKVTTETGYLWTDDQVVVEMKESVINMDSPLMVMEFNTPVGIMWAAGLTPQGSTTGIIQPIMQPRTFTDARK